MEDRDDRTVFKEEAGSLIIGAGVAIIVDVMNAAAVIFAGAVTTAVIMVTGVSRSVVETVTAERSS